MMGLFRRNTEKPLERSVEETRREVERRLESEMWADEDAREIERQRTAPVRVMAPLNLDLPGFPFSPGVYVSANVYLDGGDPEPHNIWYADAKALQDIGAHIGSLSVMLDRIAPLDRIRADLSNTRPIMDVASWLPEHYAWARINPLTPTGRTPKYVATIEFTAGLERPRHMTLRQLEQFNEVHPSPEQTLGTIDYLSDGRIGKAHLSLWCNESLYVAWYKLVAGELVVSSVTRNHDGIQKTLYRIE